MLFTVSIRSVLLVLLVGCATRQVPPQAPIENTDARLVLEPASARSAGGTVELAVVSRGTKPFEVDLPGGSGCGPYTWEVTATAGDGAWNMFVENSCDAYFEPQRVSLAPGESDVVSVSPDAPVWTGPASLEPTRLPDGTYRLNLRGLAPVQGELVVERSTSEADCRITSVLVTYPYDDVPGGREEREVTEQVPDWTTRLDAVDVDGARPLGFAPSALTLEAAEPLGERFETEGVANVLITEGELSLTYQFDAHGRTEKVVFDLPATGTYDYEFDYTAACTPLASEAPDAR